MSADYRALCAELIEAMTDDSTGCWQREADLIDRARALLAEADGPAVPDGREPASVALQPSDAEIMELMPQQMHDDLAAAVRAMAEQEGIDSSPAKGVLRIILNRHVVDLARAALARWGRPAVAPVAVSERLQQLEDLAADAVSGLRYIEQTHGRLYGVGWDRVYEKADRLQPAHALPTPEATND